MAASVAQREMTAEPENPFWSRVRDLFQEAVALEGPARAALLASCDDARVCDEVTALLESHESAGGFLEVPVFKRKGIPSGTSIGPYRIVCEIGEGGMGSVFLGVRDDDEFEQRVAIKLIRGGAAGESIMRRFRQERQILAALEHPNIARLLDGGTTADGLPYLVMEYVEGTAIDEYCDSHACSITTKLHLFLLLCEAVQYAHRNLVIHRDIKPANVLITTDGVPKLLDFGIAKLISHDTTDATVTRIMTPDYASPEQLRGDAVSTATDVYSLGVLLYRLLAGAKPFPADRRPDSEPTRPSTHSHALRGDLENILLMALHVDVSRRYGSVEQFAADIRRHLEGHPVVARPATLVYRTSKFLRRNRVAVTAGLAMVAVLAIALIVTLQQKRIAERRFTQVRALAGSFVFEMHDAIAPLPGSTHARQLLVSRALVYLDGLAAEASDDADLQMELGRAYLKIGDVQGLPYQANLGDTSGALASYRKALKIVSQLEGAPLLEADAHDRIGFVEQRLLAWRDAMEHHQSALALRRMHGGGVRERLAMARTWVAVGDCRYIGRRWIATRWRGTPPHDDYENALRVLAAIPENGAHRGELLEQRARAHQRLGGYYTRLDVSRALAHHDAALLALEQKSAMEPLSGVARRHAADQLVMRATAQVVLNDLAGAVAGTRRAATILRELAAADPTNSEAQHDLAFAYETEGSAHFRAGSWNEAEQAYRSALDIRQRLAELDPANHEDQRGLSALYGSLSVLRGKAGDHDAAARYEARAKELRAKLRL
jgi:eukaryotic-like serine/threonine-protein kinase